MFAAGVKPNSQHHIWCFFQGFQGSCLSSVLFLLEALAAPQHRILRALDSWLTLNAVELDKAAASAEQSGSRTWQPRFIRLGWLTAQGTRQKFRAAATAGQEAGRSASGCLCVWWRR